MKFRRFEVVTTTQVEELLAYNLNELGIDGVEIVNKTGLSEEDKQRMFIDILPKVYDDGISILRFFVPEEENIEATREILENELTRLGKFFDLGKAQVLETTVDDADWKDRWKEFFKPFYIENIYITPTWIQEKIDAKISIKIDPGAAFGTGLHETTSLCVRGMKNLVNSSSVVLDIGCGSGILSILADKLGAKEIVAIDIDENATRITEENFKINDLDELRYEIYTGDVIKDAKLRKIVGENKFDVVVANLLAEILVDMSKVFKGFMKKDAVLITSGILYEKEEKVKTALKEAGFSEFEVLEDGEWISVIAR